MENLDDFNHQHLRPLLRAAAFTATVALAFAASLRGEETVKIGILHSLSGTMAISEISCKDGTLLAVDEINAAGGVLGKKIEPVVVDPASNWDLFAEKAKQLVTQDKVAVTFGCWTSVSRKSVLPVYESNNACSSTRCSTRARSSRSTSSIPLRRPMSSWFPPPNT